MAIQNNLVVQQTTIALPYLEEEVPALYLADGRPYIPVFAVCRVLGIRADTHIQRWRHLVFWTTARKLLFQTEKRGKRLVWCLLVSEVPYLYSLFDWKSLQPERRRQLYEAASAHTKLLGQVYQEMQERYAATRQMLFSILTKTADLDITFWPELEEKIGLLPLESQPLAAQLLDRGHVAYAELISHTRKMLQIQQDETLIVDGVKIDPDNTVVDTFSMPLLPVVSHEDSLRLTELLRQVAAWHRSLSTLWKDNGYCENAPGE
jgi:hypothetical protein